jgi:hypothetical protein
MKVGVAGADLELVMDSATNVIGYVVVAHVPVGQAFQQVLS